MLFKNIGESKYRVNSVKKALRVNILEVVDRFDVQDEVVIEKWEVVINDNTQINMNFDNINPGDYVYIDSGILRSNNNEHTHTNHGTIFAKRITIYKEDEV